MDGKAVKIDVGRFVRAEEMMGKEAFREDLEITAPFEEWIAANYPELAEFYAKAKEKYAR